jgi:uncharacterized membrane protein
MERLTSVLIPLAALLLGLILGQQTARPVVFPEPTAVVAAASTTELASDKLTPYQRGQLITACYQARMENIGTIAQSLVVTPCLDAVGKLP